MTKKILLPVIAVVLGGSLFLTSGGVSAQNNNKDTLIQKLAQKLGIEEAKVQTAFDELHKERQTEMQNSFEEKLTQAVKDGKITESQKTAILTKHKEMQEKREALRDSLKDMTPEQRRSAMAKNRDELKSWADEQNIDLQEFFGTMGKNGMGMKMRFMR